MLENTVTFYVFLNTRNNTQRMRMITPTRQQWLHSSSISIYLRHPSLSIMLCLSMHCTISLFTSHSLSPLHSLQEYDSLRDTIEESWDQEPEARLSAQCIAERIRMFKLSKFGSKDSELTDTNSPTDLTCNSESIDSQLAPTTPSLSSSRTMSPMTSKNCMLDSGTESLGIYPGQAFSTETVRLGGTTSSNSSFLLSSRSRGSGNFEPSHHQFCGGGLSRCGHHHHHHHHTGFSNRAMYNMHSTETTV